MYCYCRMYRGKAKNGSQFPFNSAHKCLRFGAYISSYAEQHSSVSAPINQNKHAAYHTHAACSLARINYKCRAWLDLNVWKEVQQFCNLISLLIPVQCWSAFFASVNCICILWHNDYAISVVISYSVSYLAWKCASFIFVTLSSNFDV